MADEKILFVEDEDHVRKVIGTFLERSGYALRTATDGFAAIQAVQQEVPDLVLTDVNMPRVNGLELARWLRGHHTTARVPIVMLSALSQASDVLAGYAEGADEYVP